MVQRKAADGLGIQVDHVKSNKLLVSLKPSSLQHQDTKNRGADMKKKMKRSRSIKHSNLGSLTTPSLKRQVPQPGKPPPSISPSSAATPHKSSIKTSDNTPNYMRSTSSFDARKEQSQVSCRNLFPLFDSKSSIKKNLNSSEVSSASAHKPPRTLARPSSLKLVRTLTKTTSFKPARASPNKCSSLVLSENLNVQKATCSSTLKASNFPAYLTLDSGGTEAEGTSAMKVCPYTYCSLNGHHHPPLPPLKSFLSARRRMLKTQRITKLGCLSPRRSKSNKEAMEEKEMGKMNFDDKSPSQEESSCTLITPAIPKERDDFFIHIYIKERETVADTSETSKLKENDLLSTSASRNYHTDSQVPEDILDECTLSEIGSHEDSNEKRRSISGDMEFAKYSAEENRKRQEVGEVHPNFLPAEESDLDYFCRERDEEESTGSILIDDPEIRHSDMDWEEGRYSKFYLDDEVDNSLQTRQDYDLGGDSVEYDSFIIPDGSIYKSHGSVNRYFGEIQAGEIQEKSFDEESTSSNEDFRRDLEIDKHIQGSCIQDDDQHELITIYEKNNDIKLGNSVEATVNISMNALGNSIEEPYTDVEAKTKAENETIEVDQQVGDAPVKTLQTEVDAFTDYSENQFVQDDDVAERACDPDSQDFQDMTAHSTEECKDTTCSQKKVNLYQSDARIVINCINCKAFRGNTPPKKKDSESETNCLKIDAGVAAKEKDQIGPFRINITLEIIITLQGSSETVKMMSRKDLDDNYVEAIAKLGKSNHQTMADIELPGETHASDQKFIGGGIENGNSMEENEGAKFASCESTDSGDQPQSPMTEFRLADNEERNCQDTGMESTTTVEEETCPISNNTSDTGRGNDFMAENSDEEQAETCKKLNWTNKRRASTKEQEETKEFNPRAPNFLPLEPEQEAEKVDLRHQAVDDRRNSKEWMLDYALQHALNRLAPSRKKKVELLVEAFEKVMPVTDFETQMRHDSVGFAKSPRPIQACS